MPRTRLLPCSQAMRPVRALSHFKVVSLINLAVLLLGAALLVLSPATVSAPARAAEVATLLVGLCGVMFVNAILLWGVLGPLDKLADLVGEIDLRFPGLRIDHEPRGPARRLVRGFNEMLDRLESERSHRTTQAIRAQEAERQRIAAELHDEIGQCLTAVLLGVKRAMASAPPSVVSDLADVHAVARRSLEEVSRISSRLRPGPLADLGLLPALSALARDFSQYTGLSTSVDLQGSVPDLPPETELVVYRIAQEALNNVARHAQASTVSLAFVHGPTVVLTVTDDGIGASSRFSGTGVTGMHERAQMVAGTLEITTAPGQGTVVRLEIPGSAVRS